MKCLKFKVTKMPKVKDGITRNSGTVKNRIETNVNQRPKNRPRKHETMITRNRSSTSHSCQDLSAPYSILPPQAKDKKVKEKPRRTNPFGCAACPDRRR